MSDALAGRPLLVRRGLWLNYLTLPYNTVEAIVSLAAGLVAGSVALVGFGVDSGIEVTASVAAQWRLRADIDPVRREWVERVTAGPAGCNTSSRSGPACRGTGCACSRRAGQWRVNCQRPLAPAPQQLSIGDNVPAFVFVYKCGR